jgi:hypothetical protein
MKPAPTTPIFSTAVTARECSHSTRGPDVPFGNAVRRRRTVLAVVVQRHRAGRAGGEQRRDRQQRPGARAAGWAGPFSRDARGGRRRGEDRDGERRRPDADLLRPVQLARPAQPLAVDVGPVERAQVGDADRGPRARDPRVAARRARVVEHHGAGRVAPEVERVADEVHGAPAARARPEGHAHAHPAVRRMPRR